MKQVKAYLLLLMVMVFAVGCSSDDDPVYDPENPAKITLVTVNGQEYKNALADGDKVKKYHVLLPEGSDVDLAKAKLTVNFVNGWLEGFDNSGQKEMDLTRGVDVLLKEINGEITKWIITVEQDVAFEEAGIKSITANGEVLEFGKNENNTIEAKVITYTKLKDAALDIELPKGWELVGDYTKVDLTKDLEIKIKGGKEGKEEVTYILKVDATVTVKAVFEKSTTDLEFGAGGGGSSIALSGKHIVVAAHAMVDPTKAGLPIFDFAGNYVKNLSLEGTKIQGEVIPADVVYGIRKIASDIDGAIYGVELGAGTLNDVELSIYKWDNVEAKPAKIASYKGTDLGYDASEKTCRSAGIRVDGSFATNATITVPIAGTKTEVLVWKVKEGKIDAKPSIIKHKHAITGNYFSVGALGDKYLTAIVGSKATDKGIHLFSDNTFATEEATFGADMMTSEFRVVEHNGATLLAYPDYKDTNKATYNLLDITDPNAPVELLKVDSPYTGTSTNQNRTMGADIAVVEGKLYVAYEMTDNGLHLFQVGK